MKWTITIAASGENADDVSVMITAVMQARDGGEPYLAELTLRGPEGREISAQVARNIDFEKLTQALGDAAATLRGPGTVASAPPAELSPQRKIVRSERPYRKMRDIQEVAKVFHDTGSVGRLARHFDVPRYTAQAWVDRLRRDGLIEELERKS